MLFKKRRDTSNGRYIDETTAAFEGDTTARQRRSGYSSYYHKYWEGYAEKEVVGENGKKKIQRVYIGNYHIHKMTDEQWVALKFFYVTMYILAGWSFVWGASIQNVANTTIYVRLGTGIAMILFFLLLYSLINYVIAQRKLTVFGFKETSKSIKTRCLVAAGGMGFMFLTELLSLLLNLGEQVILDELKTVAGTVIAAALVMAIYFTEQMLVKYDEVPSGNVADEDAVSI